MSESSFESARTAFVAGVHAFEAGDLARAEALFVESLAHVPRRPSTLANLALVRHRLGRPAEALAPLEQALEVQPDDATAWFHHGQLLQELQRPFDALASYGRVLALDSRHATAWTQRGSLLKDMGRFVEAAECFRHALAHGGDAELNRYFLASVQGRGTATAAAGAAAASKSVLASKSKNVPAASDAASAPVAGDSPPASAPRHYVEALFDSYAEGFDEHLVGKLGYSAPSLIAGMLGLGDADTASARAPARATARPRWRAALDLGCGTGLMGPLLAPHCGAFDGVDLSSLMLRKAHALGCYRHLVHAEIVEHLVSTPERYDLVVAADVFIYLGELRPLFEGVARVLDSAGQFAFSVEEADPATERYELQPASRYAHSERYVCSLATAAGFDVRHLSRATLRHEQRQSIGGLFVLLGWG